MGELTANPLDVSPSSPRGNSPPAGWSIPAVASLACGVFVIVPFFAGIAAVALGIFGIRQTNLFNIRGRKMAIAGTVLGLLNLIGWTGYFCFVSDISAPGRTVAHHFIDDLNSANTAAAGQECLASIGADRLNAACDQIKNWGGAKNVAVLYINSDAANGVNNGSIRGTLNTPTGEHQFQLQTVDWKISDFSFQ